MADIFAADVCKCISFNEMFSILTQISLKFLLGLIDNKSVLALEMAGLAF